MDFEFNFDLASQPEIVQTAAGYILQGWDLAKGWLLSPEAWSQFGLLIVAYLAARYFTARVTPALQRLLTPPEEAQNVIATGRRFVLMFLPLLLPIAAFAFTAVGEQIVRSIFESGAVIAFGKRVFIFLAARQLANEIVQEPFLKLLAGKVLVPIAALYALGLLDPVAVWLTETVVGVGNIQFSLMSIVRGAIAGAILFWLGSWSSQQSAVYISKQDMRPSLRELSTKTAELLIFGTAFILLMSIMEINLASLAVIGGAIGVGLGFGLQKIASNFISGVILLLEGQATVGDYVELDGGEAGTIVKMTARAAILETFDGRWIVVPNEDFIVTRVVNYSDSGSANRYEAEFSVSYDTDINKVPGIINPAVEALSFVLSEPEGPDCELVGFGDSGVDFCVEYWVNGIDDGRNKYKSHVLFAIWNALKDANIEIPYPHRVVELKTDAAQAHSLAEQSINGPRQEA